MFAYSRWMKKVILFVVLSLASNVDAQEPTPTTQPTPAKEVVAPTQDERFQLNAVS